MDIDKTSLHATIGTVTNSFGETILIGSPNDAISHVFDTIDTTTVNRSGSKVSEGPNTNFTITATLTNPSQGATTVVTDKGMITIAHQQTSESLVIASGNVDDVYKDALTLMASITSVSGGNFENLNQRTDRCRFLSVRSPYR